MASSLITCEIDIEANGTQRGYLRLPHSVHRSAYGWIPIPITSIKNGEGPTILLMAGNHGDEYEGQIALSNLAKNLQHKQISGRVIIIPMLNYPAARAGLRTSPIDGGNLNRTFPGDETGTPTEIIAHYIENILLPAADYSIDLHSGGSSLFYPPTLLRGRGHTDEEASKLTMLQEAFDLPYAWVFTSGGGPNSSARTALGAANRNGVVSVMAELGGGNTLNSEILEATQRGLYRILHAVGILHDYKIDKTRGTRELTAKGSVYAYSCGLLEICKEIGESVQLDEIVAHIHHPDDPTKQPTPVKSNYTGIVLCKRHMCQVEKGDAIVQIASDFGQ